MNDATFCENLRESDYHDLIKQNLSSSPYRLLNAELQRLEDVSGFMGEYHSLTLHVLRDNDEEVMRFFIKSALSSEKNNHAIISGALYKEERMFTEILPRFLRMGITLVRRSVPRCYLVQPLKLIVFEDLRCRGYRPLNSRESLNLACVKLTLNTLAELHASALILEEKASVNGKPHRLLKDYGKEFEEVFYREDKGFRQLVRAATTGLDKQMDLFCQLESQQRLKECTAEALNKCPEFIKPSTKFRNTICHGDLWIKNLMFKFDNDRPIHCVLIDFQTYRYCPPGQDVLSFIYCSTDREFRERYFDEVLDYYHAKLTQLLQDYDICVDDVVSREEFLASCDYYKAFAIIQAVLYAHITMMTPEQTHDFISVPNCRENFFIGDRTEHISNLCDADPTYRKKQSDGIADLQNIFNL